jgi:hypothetical protein
MVNNLKNGFNLNVEVQLFLYFPAEALFGGFISLQFPPRKLPHVGMGFSIRSAGDEDSSIVAQNGGGNDNRLHIGIASWIVF